MCNNLVFLAEQDEYRFICICEHQTIHLSWDHVTIYLMPEDFLSLDICLDRAVLNHRNSPHNAPLDEEMRKKPSCLLWVFDIAIKLSLDDLLIMAELVYQGTKQLSAELPRKSNKNIHLKEWPFAHTIQVSNRITLN